MLIDLVSDAYSQKVRDRFTKLTKRSTSGCLLWTGTLDHKGYGRLVVRLNGSPRTVRANRAAWELAHCAPIPEGLIVCHTCDNPACVEPSHLFLGTIADNTLDMWSKGRQRGTIAVNAAKTACPRGHLYDSVRTGPNGRTHRFCRTCKRAADNRYNRRRRAPRSES